MSGEKVMLQVQTVLLGASGLELRGILPVKVSSALITVGVTVDYTDAPRVQALVQQLAIELASAVPHFAVAWPVEMVTLEEEGDGD